MNHELKTYIEECILPCYIKNDKAHRVDHIKYVIDRSLEFAKMVPDININMVYVIAAYHDIGHSINARNHETISAHILLADNELRKFFLEHEIKTMSEAVEDHRASLEYEPRSVYGKIISSADRNTSVDDILRRCYEYRVKHIPGASLKEIIDESYEHIADKFGDNGYAVQKMYFQDLAYQTFLSDIKDLLDNRNKFERRYIEVNKLR